MQQRIHLEASDLLLRILYLYLELHLYFNLYFKLYLYVYSKLYLYFELYASSLSLNTTAHSSRSMFSLVLDILLAKAADDSIAAVESHGFLIIVDPSQHQKDWT